MRERLESKAERTDITSRLIEASKKSDSTEADRNRLNEAAFGSMIAGSDTTAWTLLFLFYHFVHDPTQVDETSRELVQLEGRFDGKTLQSLPHLKRFINETLRLHPPVPSAGLRITPPEGLTVAGRYIPANTTVVIPVYSLHRRKLGAVSPVYILKLSIVEMGLLTDITLCSRESFCTSTRNQSRALVFLTRAR